MATQTVMVGFCHRIWHLRSEAWSHGGLVAGLQERLQHGEGTALSAALQLRLGAVASRGIFSLQVAIEIYGYPGFHMGL